MENYVIWFVGLPGAGKSTFAKEVVKSLQEKNVNLEYLRMDDEIKIGEIPRKYTEEERDVFYRLTVMNVRRLSKYTNVLLDATGHKSKWRALARRLIPNFLEVYINCPLEIAMQREANREDASVKMKDMYEKAIERLKTGVKCEGLGEVIGMDVPFEAPENPEIIVNADIPQSMFLTASTSLEKAIYTILAPETIDPRIPKLYEIIKRITDEGTHGHIHMLKVMNRAVVLGLEEKANLNILMPAALSHDIGLYFGGNGKNHSVLGAELAPEYLTEAGFTPQEQEPMLHCIAAHNERYEPVKPQTLEAKVLIDADTLEKLGLESIKRAQVYLTETGMSEQAFATDWVNIRKGKVATGDVFFTKTALKNYKDVFMSTFNHWKSKM